ncbi:cell division protein ZapE [Microbacterium sp. SORGH_AS_0888]|uniref:cell division protein ZapE n=1 Tax=Microbacterium sp. SORGH_AS_0888 TaxID=3041791 RepID=UPI00277F43A7|nr:cell division protein ZapE [Microbacterium sp. SORGH_AS_0888]MDQ1130630.1 cell division protein ZapE [Microbacterium sp. SORGH_AS_0888]
MAGVGPIEAAAAREGFALDPHQRRVAARLEALAVPPDAVGPRGVYLFGPAGRGKSWLADAWLDAVPARRKTRVHAHGMFDRLHRGIHSHRPAPDAVDRALDDVIGDVDALLFDELHVHDPGDAGLLTRLLERLFARRTTVVATSNYAPAELLPSPVWHHLFEPGIRLIRENLEPLRLEGATDYRALPHGRASGFAGGAWRSSLPPGAPAGDGAVVTVRDREFTLTATAPGVLRASFAQLCEAPLSAIEYLAWARRYPQWIVTDVPRLAGVLPAAQQRFITLVDVLCDADVTLTLVSEHDRDAVIADAEDSARPDAFRLASRLRLLRGCVDADIFPVADTMRG